MFLSQGIDGGRSIKWNISNKKEQTTGTCKNMDESQMHHAKLKKPDSKDNMLYYSIYMKFWKRQKDRE